MTHRIADIRGRNDIGIKEDSEEFDDGVEVEEHDDFLPTCIYPQHVLKVAHLPSLTDRSIFASYVEDHNGGHNNGDNVNETCCFIGE